MISRTFGKILKIIDEREKEERESKKKKGKNQKTMV